MNTLFASTTDDWRAWLAQHCGSEKEVWLVLYHKDSGTLSLRYHEAVEHALCYGWIDSQARKRDADSFFLRFTADKNGANSARIQSILSGGTLADLGPLPSSCGTSGSAWTRMMVEYHGWRRRRQHRKKSSSSSALGELSHCFPKAMSPYMHDRISSAGPCEALRPASWRSGGVKTTIGRRCKRSLMLALTWSAIDGLRYAVPDRTAPTEVR